MIKRALCVLVPLVSASMILDVPAAAEGTPARSSRDDVRQELVALVRADAGTRGPATTTADDLVDAVAALTPCAVDAAYDTADDIPWLDIWRFGATSDCTTWVFDMETVDSWRARRLAGYYVDIDVDSSSTTGCDGADYMTAATYWAGTIEADLVRTPSCQSSTWTNLGQIAVMRTGFDRLAVGFPVTMIGSDMSFRYRQQTETRLHAYDNAPDTGWRSVGSAPPPLTVPGAPMSLIATPGVNKVTLAWTAPSATGGSAVTDYVVQYRLGDTWYSFFDGVSTATTAVVAGLANGIAYTFRVAAVNAVGMGPWSPLVTATPVAVTVPAAPTNLVVTPGAGSAALTWSAPANGGSVITDYMVQFMQSGPWMTYADGTSTATSSVVFGLSRTTVYAFRVAAVNAVGMGPWSAVVYGTTT